MAGVYRPGSSLPTPSTLSRKEYASSPVLDLCDPQYEPKKVCTTEELGGSSVRTVLPEQKGELYDVLDVRGLLWQTRGFWPPRSG